MALSLAHRNFLLGETHGLPILLVAANHLPTFLKNVASATLRNGIKKSLRKPVKEPHLAPESPSVYY